MQAVRMVHSADAITGEAGFPEAGTYTITWAALLFDDGTPAAYGAFTAPFEKGAGWAYSLEWVLSRAGVGDLALTVNIIDTNAISYNIQQHALTAVLGEANSVINEAMSPLERAMRFTWEDGSQRFEAELFSPRFTLHDSAPIAIRGVVAGDDSLDLAEHTDTLTSGDYMIFNASHAEPVRILANLELGRRRVVNNLQYTYPNATLARSNWTINAGEAVCQAGGVYFARRLRLVEGDVHRVYIRALTAAGAPQLAWRADGGEFATSPLVSQRLVDNTWTDYGFEVPAGEYFYLRVQTPQETRIRGILACNTLRGSRVIAPPVLTGSQAVPGQPVSLLASAQSRLVGGSIARFDVTCGGVFSQHSASNNSAVITLTFHGAIGETRSLVVVAVDDMGNRSDALQHTLTLAAEIEYPAPTIVYPTAVAAVGARPLLSITPTAAPGATHTSTDWQIRAADGQTVVWQSLADTSNLLNVPVDIALDYDTHYVVSARVHYSNGWSSVWASVNFVTMHVTPLTLTAPESVWASASIPLATSAFGVPEGVHTATDWQIRTADGQAVVWQSWADTSHLTSINVPAGVLEPMGDYTVRARHRGDAGAMTPWVERVLACAAVWEWTAAGLASWTPPVDGDYEIVVVGGGGAGSTINGGNYMPAGNGGGSGYAARLVAALRRSRGALPLVVGAGGQTALATGNPANPGNPGAATSVGGLVAALGGLPGTDAHGGDGASGGGVGGWTVADSAGALYHGPNGMFGGWNGRDGSRFEDGSRGGVTAGRGAGVNIYYMIDPTINHAQPSSVNTVGSLQYQGGGVGLDNEYAAGGGGGGGGGAGFGPQSYGAGGAGGSKGPNQYRLGLPGRSGYIRIKLLNTNPETAQ
ncbi:glycine-rich domain-containing protein [Rivihabitans pingtungensis]|uniref:glycine-rich domain-containing protein n=1 Tax=Rivihabitans pingtungensis TaxID=1054498 RepID=UPI0023522844|nr:hypothetical protein [Rivihabitans pingtungensis]MCK6435965.1 hypothetical protein [Rivihabitans pingtungensis]